MPADARPVLTPTAEAVLGVAGMAPAWALWSGGLSDLRERLGEIRRGGGVDGFWTRGFARKDRLEGLGADLGQQVSGGSFGYDRRHEGGGGTWLTGFRMQAAHADQTVDGGGSGDLRSFGLSGYAAWERDGWYMDGVVSWDRYEQDLRAVMLDGTQVAGSFGTWGAGASLEAGRKCASGTMFLEPQLQLAFYHLKGADFTMSNGMEARQKDVDALTARAGVVAGKLWETDGGFVQPYLKAGVIREFLGDRKAVVNGVPFSRGLRETRVYCGAGLDWKVSDSLRLYGEFERVEGRHVATPWSVTAGIRYAF